MIFLRTCFPRGLPRITMILPSKHLSPKRALFTVGAGLLVRLKRPKTVSRLWEEICKEQSEVKNSTKMKQLRNTKIESQIPKIFSFWC